MMKGKAHWIPWYATSRKGLSLARTPHEYVKPSARLATPKGALLEGRSTRRKTEIVRNNKTIETMVLLLTSPLANGFFVSGFNTSSSASYRSFTTHEKRADETEKATKIRNLPSITGDVIDAKVAARTTTMIT